MYNYQKKLGARIRQLSRESGLETSKQKAYILRPNHLPVEWSDSPTEALRVSDHFS